MPSVHYLWGWLLLSVCMCVKLLWLVLFMQHLRLPDVEAEVLALSTSSSESCSLLTSEILTVGCWVLKCLCKLFVDPDLNEIIFWQILHLALLSAFSEKCIKMLLLFLWLILQNDDGRSSPSFRLLFTALPTQMHSLFFFFVFHWGPHMKGACTTWTCCLGAPPHALSVSLSGGACVSNCEP